jgi:hypothetical protein
VISAKYLLLSLSGRSLDRNKGFEIEAMGLSEMGDGAKRKKRTGKGKRGKELTSHLFP